MTKTPMTEFIEKMQSYEFFELWKVNQALYVEFFMMKERDAMHDSYMQGWKDAIEHSRGMRNVSQKGDNE